jgi:hypothetical protein
MQGDDGLIKAIDCGIVFCKLVNVFVPGAIPEADIYLLEDDKTMSFRNKRKNVQYAYEVCANNKVID